jgi:hypothetical protein
VRQRDDESAVQPDPVGITGVECVPCDLADVVQNRVPGPAADDRGLAVGTGQAEGRQAVAGAVAQVSGERVGVLFIQQARLVAAAGRACLQEPAESDTCLPRVVIRAAAARCLR